MRWPDRWRMPPYQIVTIVPPEVEPVSLAQAKGWLRVDGEDEDETIRALIAAARSAVEGHTGTRLMTQIVRITAGSWAAVLKPRVAPIQAVELSHVAGDGSVVPTDPACWRAHLDGLVPRIDLAEDRTWPSIPARSDAVQLEATVGYGMASEDLPPAVLHAIHLLLSHWYDRREVMTNAGQAAVELPFSVRWLLAPHSMRTVG